MIVAHPADERILLNLVITATFTAEPIEESLTFWMRQLGYHPHIDFAPYNQVFQQILDPASLVSQNKAGINLILFRFEDWIRDFDNNNPIDKIKDTLQEFITALKVFAENLSSPCILFACPNSPSFVEKSSSFIQEIEDSLVKTVAIIPNFYLIQSDELAKYPTIDIHDQTRDKIAHIPFTENFFTILGTVIARKIYRLKNPAHKVIVLDCDNTLWKGVVGEEGVNGIEISKAFKILQTEIVRQKQIGLLICLCSKNNESDVIEVFNQRTEMILQLDDLIAWRINWLPKSENIKSLAQEFNLGLDSFIFIDDNPVECAEVKANCPDVLTLNLPNEDRIPKFSHHLWAFDSLKITAEDRQRTELYKQNLERERSLQAAPSIETFLAGLNLTIRIENPTFEQLPRISQLTQRTNQFNFTTIRRSLSDIERLSQSNLELLEVEVSDRFGDYGLVGVMIFGTSADSLNIDTFLLSCRVLGRGVEQEMVRTLARIAQEKQLSWLQIPYIASPKNLPALNFLESIGSAYRQGDCFILPVDYAAHITLIPLSIITANETYPAAKNMPIINQWDRSTCLDRIAVELNSPEKIITAIIAQRNQRARLLSNPLLSPKTETEKQLVTLWLNLLNIEEIGIQDNYFDLGGTSLLAVELIARVEEMFAKKFSLTTLVETPTIEQFSQRIESDIADNHLVTLETGEAFPPLFLIHDGDGETLLYRNLARHLAPRRTVYGLQPYSKKGFPLLHTRIEEMAAYYLQQMQTIQHQGPYLIGGMCAGGVIAFEMARQLQKKGEIAALVAILDAADRLAAKKVGRIASQRLKRFNAGIGEKKNPLSFLNTIRKKASNLLAYEVKTKLKTVTHTGKMKLLRYYLDRSLPIPSFLQNISVRTVYLFAEKDYFPASLYNGEVTLFRATEGEGADEPYINIYTDPLLGWGERVTGEVKVFDLPGGHASMLQEPHVKVMAQTMQAYIIQALETLD